ncbi:MAG: purine-nucleoside phosphorylase [Coriobacteriia bacterium]
MIDRSLGVPAVDVDRVVQAEPDKPRVALVLGSGLSGLADSIEGVVTIPYGELQGAPDVGTVVGHAGELVLGHIGDVPVMLFAGRVHQYQGASAYDAAWPARMAAAVGCETLVVTNAAGGISDGLHPGDIVLIADHMNLTGTNPLTGWPGSEGGNPFVPMRDAYDPRLRAIAHEVGVAEGVALRDGVYAGLLGPSYETPAEVNYLRRIGADVVGMSTVPEVIAARALGMRVLGFSLVTNMAAAVGLSHDEVLETGKTATAALARLVLAILRKL